MIEDFDEIGQEIKSIAQNRKINHDRIIKDVVTTFQQKLLEK